MNVENYSAAQRYVNKVTSQRKVAELDNQMDVVHDAYLRWYDKCGKNLFDETKQTIARVIKYTMLSQWEKGGFMKDGETFRRNFTDLPSYDPVLTQGTPSPEELMIAEDLHESVSLMLKDDYLTVFDLLAADYRLVDIAERMGCTPQYVSWLVKRIREIVVRHVGR